MADNDQTTDEGNDSPVITDLRKQLRDAQKELSQLRDEKRSQVLSETFAEFGLDPSKAAGKFAAQSYDGELDPDEVRGWLQEQGFEKASNDEQTAAPPQPDARQQAEARGDAIRQSASPSGEQRVSHDDFMQMLSQNPQRARQLHDAGLVDRPAHIERQLQVNANSTPFG